MNHSRLARSMARADILRLVTPVLGFSADPTPPRPTLDAARLVGVLMAQGHLPQWRVMAIGAEGAGLEAVLIDVAVGPIRVPMALDAAGARRMAETLAKAAADVEASQARPPSAPAPDGGPDIVVTDQVTG